MPQPFQAFWTWATTDPLGITIFGGVLSALLVIIIQAATGLPGRAWRGLLAALRRALAPRERHPVSVFDVVTDPEALLPQLYNAADTNPLADHRLPY